MRDLAPEDPAAIGPYRLTGSLGEGGMGKVYLAQSRGRRRVAVKVVRPEIAADPGFRERFRREIEAARAVGGFWTAPIVDADPDAATPWVATDYIAAPNLAEHVNEYGPYGVDELVSLTVGLAEALETIHRAGLVHRDLKPSNILATDDGPRVIDFGISKAVQGLTTLTDTGLIIGSPGFMSPEQASGGRVGPSSDIFSLGTVLVFAATGKGPFDAESIPAMLYRVVHDTPSLNGVPEGLQEVLAACLEKSAERRPTPGKLLDRLNGASLPAPTRPMQRHEATTATSPAQTAAEPTPAVDARVSHPTWGYSDGGKILIGLGLLISIGTILYYLLSGDDGLWESLVVPGLVFFIPGSVLCLWATRHPREVVIEVTGQGLNYVHLHWNWRGLWGDVQSVTLAPFRHPGIDRVYWEVKATWGDNWNPVAQVPKPFRVKGHPRAARILLLFTGAATTRAELTRLDVALRHHAAGKYNPDPALIALLRSS
ncbi:serine/threonine-protein kinase [Streptomyces sp. HB132]|uniref:serine/threonine-protein kinase n=1 Tax=Streptomyces sp. HB132 TaxID=767388 RepID=UPI0023BADE71|nr:protein kinase [Streptomyces sp. HB132]